MAHGRGCYTAGIVLKGPVRRLLPAILLFAAAACSDTGPASPTPVEPTYQLTGTVRDASASIVLSGVVLSAVDGPNAGKSATTGGDGRYTLSGLTSGTFTLRAQLANYDDHLQQVTITTNTNIDIRMIPGRSVSSGWSAGTFFAVADGARIGARMTTIHVSQSGTTVNGTFTTADGGSGSFTGQLAGTQFSGMLRAEIILDAPARRCRGTSTGLTGTMAPDNVALAAPAMTLENCSATVTDVMLTLTP